MQRQTPNRKRYDAALAVVGGSYAQICVEHGLSRQSLRDALTGARKLSARVEEALRSAVGAAGWRYAMGETNELPAPTARAA